MTERVHATGFIGNVWRGVVQWGVRIGLVVMITLVVLLHLHVIEDERVLLVLFSALILLLSEQLRSTADRFEARISNSDNQLTNHITSVTTQMNNHSNAIKGLIENTTLRLYSLNECVEHIAATLRSIAHDKPVVIEHLGLDLTIAWEQIERLLRSGLDLDNLEYRTLILTDEATNIPGASEEVIKWSRSASYVIDAIIRDVSRIKKDVIKDRTTFNFTLKKYAAVPVVHGFRIVSPVKECYMAICRWGSEYHNRYEWGYPQYHKIIGDALDPVSRDMLNIFHGYFEHLWLNSSEIEFTPETQS